jgi:hypothetical protein
MGDKPDQPEAALLRFRGEPTHESVTVPKLNVVVVNELFGRFDGGGIVRVIVREFGYDGTELPVDADDVSAIIWHGTAPFDQAGARYSQSPNTAEGRAMISSMWWQWPSLLTREVMPVVPSYVVLLN